MILLFSGQNSEDKVEEKKREKGKARQGKGKGKGEKGKRERGKERKKEMIDHLPKSFYILGRKSKI